jgi:hypothetical protein
LKSRGKLTGAVLQARTASGKRAGLRKSVRK